MNCLLFVLLDLRDDSTRRTKYVRDENVSSFHSPPARPSVSCAFEEEEESDTTDDPLGDIQAKVDGHMNIKANELQKKGINDITSDT